MPPERLIQMANSIAQFFEAQPDRQEAVAGVAEHLNKFWEPRMRQQLLSLAASPAGDAVSPLVREALGRVRD
jgi:formate dehydrogenase subunit delta